MSYAFLIRTSWLLFGQHFLVSRFMYVLKYEVSHLITGRRVPVNDAMPLLPSLVKIVQNSHCLIFSLYIYYIGLSVWRTKSYVTAECLHMFEPSITHNLITCVLTFYLVKLTQSSALEQEHFDLQPLPHFLTFGLLEDRNELCIFNTN